MKRPLLFFFCFLWIAARAWLSWGRYYGQDELESMHQGWLLYAGYRQFVDFNSNHPPLFFRLLSVLNHVTSDPERLLWLGRGVTFLSSAVQLVLVGRLAAAVYGTRAGRWAVAAYALSATFLEWSTEIRTDALMVPLWLGAVLVAARPAPGGDRLALFAVGLLTGLGFWANQKIVLAGLPLVIFVAAGGPRGAWRPRDLWIAATGALLPTIALVALAAAEGSLASMIRLNFLGAAGLTLEDPYAGWRGTTIRDTFWRDTGFVLLAARALAWAIVRWPAATRSERFLTGSACWVAATFALTPGPFHYYLLTVFPLFAATAGGFLATRRFLLPTSRLPAAAAAGLCLLYVVPPLARLERFRAPTNTHQREVIRIGTAITDPEDSVFDGTGALVVRPDAYGFHWILWQGELARYAAGELPPLMETLRSNRARLVLETRRVRELPEETLERLLGHFPTLWGPIRVPGYDSGPESVGSEPREFELWYDGLYEIEPPGAVVDGLPVRGRVHLAAGMHTIALRGRAAPVRVRDASYRGRAPLPSGPAPATFFGPYGYDY